MCISKQRALKSSHLLMAVALGVIAGCSPDLAADARPPVQARKVEAICVAKLQFSDEVLRVQFLQTNAEKILEGVREQDIFVLSGEDFPEISVIAQNTQCSGLDLRRAYGLRGTELGTIRLMQRSVDDVRNELARQYVRQNESHIWRCVVRIGRIVRGSRVDFSSRDVQQQIDTFERVAQPLPFAGLRDVQFELVNGNMFFAANDSCSLLSRYVSASFKISRRTMPRQSQNCEHSSLRGCGYPTEWRIE